MRRVLLVAALLPFTAFAQSSSWQAKAKIQSGTCADGVVVFVTESPGKARLNMTYEGRPTGQLDIDLDASGGGFVENAKGVYGPTTFQLFAGKGKRAMKSVTNDGKCTWTWQ
jgi:hypothetical protein